MNASEAGRLPVVLAPGSGRDYAMGPVSAVFKADGAESEGRYSISEWWLEPQSKGPGTHHHPEDDIFFVLGGTLHLLVDAEWIEATTGTFVLVPANVPHDFENRGSERAGFLNLSIPGNFERHMPGIADWFRHRSEADSKA